MRVIYFGNIIFEQITNSDADIKIDTVYKFQQNFVIMITSTNI